MIQQSPTLAVLTTFDADYEHSAITFGLVLPPASRRLRRRRLTLPARCRHHRCLRQQRAPDAVMNSLCA